MQQWKGEKIRAFTEAREFTDKFNYSCQILKSSDWMTLFIHTDNFMFSATVTWYENSKRFKENEAMKVLMGLKLIEQKGRVAVRYSSEEP
jgi:hypothetical protein